MLIRNAEVWTDDGRGPVLDVRIADDRVAGMGTLAPLPGERVVEAAGATLLPGLHDHHIHLAGLAARSESLWCGPPEVTDAEQFAHRLRAPGTGWIRAIGYHESVLGGLPNARALDRHVSDRPLRLQHRSGRMWMLNSAALEILLAHGNAPAGLERDAMGFTGRLFDEDAWLREALGSIPPDFSATSRRLAAVGVTGITDMTPQNGPAMAHHFSEQIASGALTQRCTLAGELGLSATRPVQWAIGPAKLHLHEAALPEFADATSFIRRAHELGRAVAIHCVSEVELVFALATLEEAGTLAGDRIEHASIASDHLIERIAALNLSVCVQPHFIAERGDRYLSDVDPRHVPDLYRLRGFAQHGVAMAGGSDAPFGDADPWAAMRSAVERRTASGQVIGPQEALTPEQAVALYLVQPDDLSIPFRVTTNGRADLILLDRPWREARTRLSSENVVLTLIAGRVVHDRVDQTPVERLPSAEPPT